MIPDDLPNDSKVMILFSGGTDSSSILYLLAQHVAENNLDWKLIPVTFKRPKPNHPPGAKRSYENICKNIEMKYGSSSMIQPLIVNDIYQHKDEEGFDENNSIIDFYKKGYAEGKWNVVYDGNTSIPSYEILEEHFKDQSWKNMSTDRLPENKREEIGQRSGFYYISPYTNKDKRFVAELYSKYNMLENIFPITKSCESVDTDKWEELHHCGKCWWCEERQWAFGRLQ